MKKLTIPNSVSRKFHKVGFQLKKHSPEILVVTGIVGTVASAIMACKATTKATLVVDDAKKKLNKINEGVAAGEAIIMVDGKEQLGEYTPEDGKKDSAIVYGHTGLTLVKLYAPSVILGALSITSILTSHNIIRKRNVALAAAYATVDKSFKDYRGRVVERFGKELDRELKYNIKTQEVTEKVVDEDGNEKTITKTVEIIDPNTRYSDFARCFDESCPAWTKSPEDNFIFLKQVQAYANDKLRAQGWLELNEVYEMLGFPKTKAGMIVGWVYDTKRLDEDGRPMFDNFIDFGLFDDSNERARAFVNGHERNFWVDFNVDGNLHDLL